jgi:hypothetical protein
VDFLRHGYRLARARPGGPLAAVLGLALGLGALLGAATLLRGYDDYEAWLSRNPLSREFRVTGLDMKLSDPSGPSLAEGARVEAAVEGVETSYKYSSRLFVAAAGDGSADEIGTTEIPGMMVSPNFFDAYDLTAAGGSLFDERNHEPRSGVAVVGAALAKTLYKGRPSLGRRITLDGAAFTVIGVLEPDSWEDGAGALPFDEMIFTPRETREPRRAAAGALAGGFEVGSLAIMMAPGKDPAKMEASLQNWFDRSYGEGRLLVSPSADGFRREAERRKGLLRVLGTFAGAAAAAAELNFLLIMAARVRRRSLSYGIMRAVGARREAVFAFALAETCLAAGAGALISLPVSVLLFNALERALGAGGGPPARLDLGYLVGATLAAALAAVALVAAPAVAAARSSITDALGD